jgi:hypothetical protein
MENKTSTFAVLNKINCNEHTEKKNGLTYLSWAWAWKIIKTNFPDAFYTIYENEQGIPYFTDGKTCWVKTGVTIQGLEHMEYLPIMNFSNKSIPLEQVTSTDMNKAIQRSLTKACARHGLGLYIYAGEDIPEDGELQTQQPPQEQPSQAVQARRKAASRATKPAAKSAYTPVEQGLFNKMVENYVHGVAAKDGGDYRTAWINYTHAGDAEIAIFDQAVNDYMNACGL